MCLDYSQAEAKPSYANLPLPFIKVEEVASNWTVIGCRFFIHFAKTERSTMKKGEPLKVVFIQTGEKTGQFIEK